MRRIFSKLRAMTLSSQPGGPGLGALAAAMTLLATCSSGHAPAPPPVSPAMTAAHSPAAVERAEAPQVERWGSFFADGSPNTDTGMSPVPGTLPRTVAEVGSSNSTQYALLTNGRLYAWGLGGEGELGDGDL